MKIARYVETFSYVGMFDTMNFAYYICHWVLQDVSEDPVVSYSCQSLLYRAFLVYFADNKQLAGRMAEIHLNEIN